MARTNYTSVSEEIFNAISHGVGASLCLIGWLILVILAVSRHNPTQLLGFSIFSLTMFLMYLASTLFHSLCFTRAKKVFRIFDHASVFLFIAGTYTPFLLLALPRSTALNFVLLIWVSAILGIIFKVFFINSLKLSLLFYLAMGWVGFTLFNQTTLSLVSRNLLLLGGVAYTLGILFYIWKKLTFNHGLWHLFVLAGSLCHFLALVFIPRFS